ncbi:MAG: PD-(D/E)XK nuclease family protein, partial [Nanoarchaeota archaeon]
MKKIKDKKIYPPILKEIKNYKPVVMDYSFQKSISYSQFSTFVTCPKKWSLTYREGHYQSESSINMTFGTALHNTLQNYLTVFYNESTVEADRIELDTYFKEQLSNTYKADYEKNNQKHFSNSEEMGEFYDDGLMILNFLKKKKGEYFSKRGWHLVGCEVPILTSPYERFNNVVFKGYIDLVLYNEELDKFVIYDIKTSTAGWKDYQKKDEVKVAQILLYKYFFSKQFNVP